MIPRTLAFLLPLLAGPAFAQAPAPEAAAPPATAEPPAPAEPAAAAPTPAQVAPVPATNQALTDPAVAPGAPGAVPTPARLAADPAPTPPAPARLDGAAGPASPRPALPSWPASAQLLDNGALRLRMTADAPDAALRRALEEIGRQLATLPAGRVTVEVQVSPHPRDASLARRASLTRARAVKAALVAGGVPETRIDLRPLGRLDPPADLVDILPPGAGRTQAPR